MTSFSTYSALNAVTSALGDFIAATWEGLEQADLQQLLSKSRLIAEEVPFAELQLHEGSHVHRALVKAMNLRQAVLMETFPGIAQMQEQSVLLCDAEYRMLSQMQASGVYLASRIQRTKAQAYAQSPTDQLHTALTSVVLTFAIKPLGLSDIVCESDIADALLHHEECPAAVKMLKALQELDFLSNTMREFTSSLSAARVASKCHMQGYSPYGVLVEHVMHFMLEAVAAVHAHGVERELLSRDRLAYQDLLYTYDTRFDSRCLAVVPCGNLPELSASTFNRALQVLEAKLTAA